MDGRLSCNDITDTVNVERPKEVCRAVQQILEHRYPGRSFEMIEQAFADLERLFVGSMPGYHACDTLYHDLRHTLDVTLAMARLVEGHDRVTPEAERLGPDRAALGIVIALLHDAGYIRATQDAECDHGAQYTRVHVARSAGFISRYLPLIGLARDVPVASQIVHFTGYEVAFDRIEVSDPRDRTLGHLLGTADLIAQMSDRLYLEKCRDYLYEEFVLGGVAEEEGPDGSRRVVYSSPEDLLVKTPDFHSTVIRERLEEGFRGAHRFAAAHFAGRDLYGEQIASHIRYLRKLIGNGRLDLLRRVPRTMSLPETLVEVPGRRRAA